MSQRLDTTITNVRQLLRDTNLGNPVFGSEIVRRYLNGSMQRLAADAGMGQSSATIALVAGTRDYALSSAIQYASISQVVRDSDGEELFKLSLEQINRELENDPQGTPEKWGARESTAQVVTVRVCPIPTASDAGRTLTVWLSPVPDDASAASSSIAFSSLLLKALERDVAASLIAGATEDQIAKIGVGRQVVAVWQREVEKLIRLERVRRNRIKRTQDFVLGKVD